MSNATRTPQQAYKDAKESGAIDAWMEGKPIEVRDSAYIDNWGSVGAYSMPNFTSTAFLWRPAPTPRLRPWKPEEVPKKALYRRKAWALTDPGSWSSILAVSLGKIAYISASLCMDDLNDALKKGEHSLDGGKTWAPCGVQEGGE